jgi:hypothetical protein
MPIDLIPTPPESKSPNLFLFYASPKLGKSSLCAGYTTDFQPGSSIIINTQPGGYRFLNAVKIDALSPKEFNDAVKEVQADDRIKTVIVDHLSVLDEWAETVGTYRYMAKAQGKRWNAKNPADPNSGRFSPNDKEWTSVHELGEGFGYTYSRAVMSDWLNQFILMGKRVILVAHIKDKYISAAKDGEFLTATELDLTGKVKGIYTKKVDSIAKLIAEGNERYLSFEARNEHEILGAHSKHLKGKIKISDYIEEEDKVVTYWEKIFID